MTLNFELKPWTLDYASDFAENANNRNISKYLRDGFPYPFTESYAKDIIRSFIRQGEKEQCVRAIVADNHAVGSIGVFIKDDVYCKSGELGYWLSEKYWGCGIMTRAIELMTTYVFDNYDILRIYAEPFEDNPGSRKVLMKSGFQLEGIMKKSVYKLGKVHDSCMYALIK